MHTKTVEQMARDIYYMSQGAYYDSNYRIYDQSNENLCELFQRYSVQDKDVLTVLASSDQLISCYCCGAKIVDSFDKVFITLYYYYLRKWLILYQNALYPSYRFYADGDDDLYQLVCNVKPSNPEEEEAKLFWKLYMEFHHNKVNKYLFDVAICNQPKPFEHRLEQVKNIIQKPINFKCMDMFQTIDFSKQYDVLVLSNMLEYAQHPSELVQARDNIESLLKDDGIAICSYKNHSFNCKEHIHEIDILTSQGLELEDNHYAYYEPLIGSNKDLAYSYRLKKKG